MNCIFCNKSSGFLKKHHQECYEKTQQILKDIEKLINSYNNEEISAKNAKVSLVEIATSSNLYNNYLKYELDNLQFIKPDETVIYFENYLALSESKNRCTMVRTGYRYEKKPNWNDTELLIHSNATIIFTDKRIYLIGGSNNISYEYKKIINLGFDKIFGYVYFDVKTSSKIPHRFLLRPSIKKEKTKIHNICLFLNCFISK